VSHATPGAIIYLHDGKHADHVQFVQSVEWIIQRLQAEGYRFVRLDEGE
jgi:peptidoglycan/xylan/chitin deacetylase (PgdA/CDA1 family)